MAKIKLKIPVKPYLLKFICLELDHQPEQGPIEITGKSLFANYILGIAEESDRPQKITSPHYLEFHLPERTKSYDGRSCFITISPKNVVAFNNIVEEVFNDRYFHVLDLLEKSGQASRKSGRKMEVINNLIEKYSTREGELTYGMLRMRHERWKKKPKSLLQQVIK